MTAPRIQDGHIVQLMALPSKTTRTWPNGTTEEILALALVEDRVTRRRFICQVTNASLAGDVTYGVPAAPTDEAAE